MTENERSKLLEACRELKRFAEEHPVEIVTAKQMELTPENLAKVGEYKLHKPNWPLAHIEQLMELHKDEWRREQRLRIIKLKERNLEENDQKEEV